MNKSLENNQVIWDVAVIGGGPGGYVAAISAAQKGAKVCVIEADNIGGTCLNYGCIPTKALYKNAEVLHTIRNSESFGVKIDNYSIDVDLIHERKDKVVNSLVTGVEKLLKANGIEVIRGFAHFQEEKKLAIETLNGDYQFLEAKNIIIATGSEPRVLPIEGLDLDGVYSSKEMMNFKEIPETLTIIGGGVIGLEFASVFNALGSKVKVIEYGSSILRHLDTDLSKRMTQILKKSGIEILTSTQVLKIEKNINGLIVKAEKDGEIINTNSDSVLVSSGRTPLVEGLNLEIPGVAYTNRGIGIDKHFMTNIEGIYAIGDVNGKTMLAHAASHQGVSAVEHIMNHTDEVNHDIVPACIFTFPEIAVVGLSETQAKEQGVEYKVSKFVLGGNGKALAIGDSNGFVKVLADMENKIIGVQILGPHASDLIHEGTLAVSNKMSAKSITQTIHAHPSLSESFHEAVLGLDGKAIHGMPKMKKRKSA